MLIDDDVEFTLEANPDDLSREKLTMIRDTPVNRLSIGVQSFNNKDLKYLNRVHDKDQALTAIEETLKAGFDNVSVDLIYGIPGQHEERWSKNLDILAGLCIPHISAYALTVEPGTILDNRISKNKKIQPDEDLSIIHFKRLMSFMGEKGYIHYEISNFCKKGFHSLHNSNYWFGKKYLGIGPSAHSFNIDQRQWNVANISTYIDRLKNEIIPFQKETLSTEQMFNEYLMISLRTIQGCDLNYIKKTFGKSFYRHCIRESGAYLDKGFLRLENEKLFLTIDGKLFADRIASDMFFAE